MNKILKKLISIGLMVSTLSMLGSNVAKAEASLPSSIRVGLYYTDSSKGVYTAQSILGVSAQKGLQLGFFSNSVFNLLFEEPTNNQVSIRKDAYYAVSNGSLKEYQTSQTIPEGTKLGPYHIQIGTGFSDCSSALEQVKILKTLGIQAYPAFTDQWQVWTGFYTDSKSAQNDLLAKIQVKLTPDTASSIIQPSSNRIVASSSSGEVQLVFGGDTNKLIIRPKVENNPNILKINNKSSYRGYLEIRRNSSSDMTIINVVSLDQYLYGVVPPEIGAASHPEALKAQAMAAKNYAAGSLGKHGKLGFDVCPTTDCQVYKGFDAEGVEANKAIDAVSGKKITYQGKLVLSYFFASSGGMTEDVKNVWGSDYPYLKSVEDNYESGKSYNYNWVVTKSADSIEQVMQGRSSDVGNILSVQVTKTAPSGRATELTVTGTKDSKSVPRESTRILFGLSSQWYSVTTDADTYILGLNGAKIKTQLGSKNVITGNGLKQVKTNNNGFTVIGANGVKKSIPVIPKNYIFTGKGWGHSVGLSQEGAKGMAKAGFTYDQIIKHYYTGVEIE